MYGEARITRCTKPPPDSCKLTVDLESKLSANFVWSTVESKTTDWRSCKKLTLRTPPYTCHASPEKYEFASLATLQIEAFGRHKNHMVRSVIVKFYCQG